MVHMSRKKYTKIKGHVLFHLVVFNSILALLCFKHDRIGNTRGDKQTRGTTQYKNVIDIRNRVTMVPSRQIDSVCQPLVYAAPRRSWKACDVTDLHQITCHGVTMHLTSYSCLAGAKIREQRSSLI